MVSNYRDIPAQHVYIKGQNDRRAIRTLTARLLEDVSERTLIFDLPGAYVARFTHRTFVMRVHTSRHCGEVFPSYPDLRHHLDSHLQPPVGHICTTCKK